MNDTSTPVTTNIKKRELSSPEFTSDLKKNRLLSGSLSESVSDISISETEAETENMASNKENIAEQLGDLQHLTLEEVHLQKIAAILQETFQPQLSTLVQDTISTQFAGMVKAIVDGVLAGLTSRISALEQENVALKNRVVKLETAMDSADQYSRRNCLTISGIPETENENTDALVMELARAIDVDLDIEQIDRTHRLCRPSTRDSPRNKPRAIIIKFATYRARQKLYKARTLTKDRNYRGVFINEHLTKARSELLYEARRRVKSKQLKSAWSSDGTVLIKFNNETVARINDKNELPELIQLPNQ